MRREPTAMRRKHSKDPVGDAKHTIASATVARVKRLSKRAAKKQPTGLPPKVS